MAKADGLTQEERDAVKERAKELREQEKAGKNREAGEKAVRDAIAKLTDEDQVLANGFYDIVADVAPDLVPKTYYGMPGFANADGKILVFMQPASKFKTRYSTIGFEQPAALDDGDMWATAFALIALTPQTKKKLADLVKTAVS
ncbi:MAG: hypothetical protein ABWY37_05575 [Microbacterium pygmaeum]|uniref:Uncharacterized conserved protein YdhG, YjbR/CyaY-like superfamily, DUF1801 family n=1 Tax=Microbacterium pygmaeum TaxID=370764 RepID=A0A1G7UXP5_9MICO|nr:hypothetical protein [Microbacterium pygmaeum]SDG52041.1 Uncharacterized conserved protein YdhG, YjbR/CyaY-like superfamily, DUF1801 family [Microbacterium pygmaeum]